MGPWQQRAGSLTGQGSWSARGQATTPVRKRLARSQLGRDNKDIPEVLMLIYMSRPVLALGNKASREGDTNGHLWCQMAHHVELLSEILWRAVAM